jgi:predicted outer membrane protein/sortase (surface protein transpeptidase)
MRVIAAIAGLVLAIALAISALHAYANATANQSGSNNNTASSQDATFLQVTQQYNLAEQTFGQIAQDRGQATGITQLATTTINGHKNAQTKVASLASSLGVDLPTTLSSVQQAQADQLKSVASSSFDLTYAENQVAGHQQSIASTQQEISHGSNSDVVSYAKSFLSLEQSHLHEAQTQLNALSGGGSGGGGGNTSEGGSSSGGGGGGGGGGSGGGSSPTAVPAGTGGSAARAPAELRARLTFPSHAQASPQGKSRPATDDAGAGPPMVIALPSVDVTALVVPVGVSHGNLQVPDNATQVGWWVSSAVAGAKTGSVIIDGHVDTEHGGLGALYRMGIGDLRVGDRIMLTTMFDRQVSYRIYAQDLYAKAAGLPADVLSQSREPRLVLITCGGPFDFTSRNYEDNVVVYARPTSD